MLLAVGDGLLADCVDQLFHTGGRQLRAIFRNRRVHVVDETDVDGRAILLHDLVYRGKLRLHAAVIDDNRAVFILPADLSEALLQLVRARPSSSPSTTMKRSSVLSQ